MSRRWKGVRGKERERIGKTGESETERRGEAWPDVNNKGTSVPAPGPAKLGGGRRAEEANEDKEGGGGARERSLAQDPWSTLIFQKTGSTLTWALAPATPRPTAAAPPPSQIGQGSALNKQLYKSWWSLCQGEERWWKLTTSQPSGRQETSTRSHGDETTTRLASNG